MKTDEFEKLSETQKEYLRYLKVFKKEPENASLNTKKALYKKGLITGDRMSGSGEYPYDPYLTYEGDEVVRLPDKQWLEQKLTESKEMKEYHVWRANFHKQAEKAEENRSLLLQTLLANTDPE